MGAEPERVLKSAQALDIFPLAYRALPEKSVPSWAKDVWRGHLARVTVLGRGAERIMGVLGGGAPCVFEGARSSLQRFLMMCTRVVRQTLMCWLIDVRCLD